MVRLAVVPKLAKESSLREVVRGLWVPCRRRDHYMVRLAVVPKMAKESSLREVVRGLPLAQKGTPVCCVGRGRHPVKVSEAEWIAR